MSCPTDALTDAPALTVWFEDEHLVVVEKRAGELAVPGRGPDKADCLARRVQARWPDALTVHRLDQATSGLMVWARGATMQRRLGAAFERREVAKRYVAVVAGRLPAASGCIDLPLAADWPHRPRQQVDHAAGKPSLTRWAVLEAAPDGTHTRVALIPETGRTHQLRVHLMAIGHPILGDALYGDDAVRDRAPRLLLHAEHLAFAHPQPGRPALQLASPPPF